MTYQSLNSFDDELIKSFDVLGDPRLETKIVAAQACFQTWCHKSYAERAAIIAKAGDILHARAGEFARIRPWRWASGSTRPSCRNARSPSNSC